MLFLREMSSKKAQNNHQSPEKNLLWAAQFQGMGDRWGRGSLFWKLGEGRPGGGRNGWKFGC
jgi:hypothetical protein